METEHQKLANRIVTVADTGAGLLYKIMQTNGVKRRSADSEGGGRRCQAFSQRANHWQCDTKVQDLKDKLWRNEELKNLEKDFPRLLEKDLEKAAKSYKAKTGVGCDGFHPKFRWI